MEKTNNADHIKNCGKCKDLRYDPEKDYFYCSTDSESLLEGCEVKPDEKACECFRSANYSPINKIALIESLSEIPKIYQCGRILVNYEFVLECIDKFIMEMELTQKQLEKFNRMLDEKNYGG